ncbi:MAG: PAS domain S-box protein, partial [Chloroflexi bacterium]
KHDQNDPQSLSANPVFAITQDTSGILWVGTDGGGLNRMDPNTGEFMRYQHDAQEPTSLAANSVWCIYPDPSGGLWVGTSAGLNHFDPNSHSFRRYSSRDGLPSQFINGIVPDSLDNLWLSTDQGLFWYNPLSGNVRVFNETDGLLDDDFELKAYFRDSEGQLFFGTNQGIIAFDPNQIQDNPYVPPVMITSLELENNPVQIDSSSVLEQTILQTESLEIPYSNRIISFSFSSLNFDAPKNNRYRYILEGFDDHWYEVSSSRRRVTYTNLDPGEYVFRVIGSNNDGVWNEIGTSITIRVIPPWWMTIWFRITVIVLSAGILLLTYNIQTSRIRQQNRLLETMVSSRTTQLEDINLSLKSEIAARQQVEEELRTSEARYRTIFETSGTAMAIAAEDFSLLLVNQEYERLSGYSREELESGMKWTDFVYPEDEDRVKGYNQLGWKDPMKPPRSYEFRFVNRNRQVRHVLSTASRIPGTKRVVASLQDITLYKELETMLQLQNERYKRATQAAGAGVYEWDLLTGNFYLDPSIKSFLGYEDWEIPNDIEIWATYIHPDDRQSTMESANAAIRGETPEYRCEYRMLARDGSIRWVLTTGQVLRDSNGQPLRMVGTDRDVTLRKQAEIQLKASEERFRSVWEAANDAMVLIDLGGNILAVNPAFYDLFGLDGEHVIEKHFTELVLQQDLEMVEKDFQTALSNEPMLRFERQISRRDGTSVVVDVSISSIILEAEQRMILAVVRDITSRKEVETSLKKVSNQLTTLLVVSQNIVSLMDIDPLLDLVLEQLTQVIPYDAAAILSIDQGRIEPLVYRGSAVPEEISYLRSHISENPILQQTARSKEVCYIEDSYAQDKLQERFGGSLAEWGEGFSLYRSWLAIPLIVKENQIGILVLA